MKNTIQQIDEEIKFRGLSVRAICESAKVNPNTYYNALRGGDIKNSTLVRLQDCIGKKSVLINKDL